MQILAGDEEAIVRVEVVLEVVEVEVPLVVVPVEARDVDVAVRVLPAYRARYHQ